MLIYSFCQLSLMGSLTPNKNSSELDSLFNACNTSSGRVPVETGLLQMVVAGDHSSFLSLSFATLLAAVSFRLVFVFSTKLTASHGEQKQKQTSQQKGCLLDTSFGQQLCISK